MVDDDFSRLMAEVNAAKANYRKLMEEFNEMAMQQAANPHGLQAIKLAHERLDKATEQYSVALKSYTEHFRRERPAQA
jgi:hypothetical protein